MTMSSCNTLDITALVAEEKSQIAQRIVVGDYPPPSSDQHYHIPDLDDEPFTAVDLKAMLIKGSFAIRERED